VLLDFLYPFGSQEGDTVESYADDSCYSIDHSDLPMFGKKYSTIYVWFFFYNN